MGVLFPEGVSRERESFAAYQARGGYQALARARETLTPEGVLELVEAAGLLGRGGAAFPVATKRRLARQEPQPRYLVLNGGEDEPGSLKGRVLMERHPHLVLERMRLVPEGACMVEEALRLAVFFEKECCGQCPACRMETGMLRAILAKLQMGEGLTELVPQVEKVVSFAKDKGLCSFIGMPAPPILSALRLFPEDFEAHLQQKRGPAA